MSRYQNATYELSIINEFLDWLAYDDVVLLVSPFTNFYDNYVYCFDSTQANYGYYTDTCGDDTVYADEFIRMIADEYWLILRLYSSDTIEKCLDFMMDYVETCKGVYE